MIDVTIDSHFIWWFNFILFDDWCGDRFAFYL